MDFSTPPPGGKFDGAQKGQLMEQVKAQIAVANAQELLQVRYKAGLPLWLMSSLFYRPGMLFDGDVKLGITTRRSPHCHIGDYLDDGRDYFKYISFA